MRNASAIGTATPGGRCLDRANASATGASASQQIPTLIIQERNAVRKSGGRSGWMLAALVSIVTSMAFIIRAAETPPPDLLRRIAHHEDETVEERKNYAYRQTLLLQELNDRGGEVGRYSEARDIVFSPGHERSERTIGLPLTNLKNLKMTDEDFADIRNIQPFVLREELIPNYEVKFKGEEAIDGEDCWVLQLRPKQMLQNQRFFEGLLWASKKSYAIVRTEGQAVPQIYSLHQENLFPRFTTIRRPVNGNFWFPVLTYADDTLPFRTGPLRIKMTIRYTQYQKFGSSSVVTFGDVK
jgi:hypothetical protein